MWNNFWALFVDIWQLFWSHCSRPFPLSWIFFKKGQPSLFSNYFRSFQTNNKIFTTNQCEKMSCPSSIRGRDSNPRPLEHEPPPITTRPGHPSNLNKILLYLWNAAVSMQQVVLLSKCLRLRLTIGRYLLQDSMDVWGTRL